MDDQTESLEQEPSPAPAGPGEAATIEGVLVSELDGPTLPPDSPHIHCKVDGTPLTADDLAKVYPLIFLGME